MAGKKTTKKSKNDSSDVFKGPLDRAAWGSQYPTQEIRKIVGCNINRVNRIVKHIKAHDAEALEEKAKLTIAMFKLEEHPEHMPSLRPRSLSVRLAKPDELIDEWLEAYQAGPNAVGACRSIGPAPEMPGSCR